MIYAKINLVDVTMGGTRGNIIESRVTGGIRIRIILEEVCGNGIDTSRRNHIVCKRATGHRINHRRTAGENPLFFQGRRNNHSTCAKPSHPQTLIVDHEKGAVSPVVEFGDVHRPGQHEAELIIAISRLRRRGAPVQGIK